jgi:hypothetical protein
MSNHPRVLGFVLAGLAASLVLMAGVALAALPPGGTFIDDNGNTHEPNIEAIAAEGITKGCNPPGNDKYCPGNSISRGQIAAFLNRALDLPGSSVDYFSDDDASIFEADINAIAHAGLAKGCNPPVNDNYCPDQSVTRGQMAAFLRRAFEYPGTETDHFVDDDASIFEADIDAIAHAGVTKGCNPPANDRYCAGGLVTRAQMASFLARAFGLDPIAPPPAPAPPPPPSPTTTTKAPPASGYSAEWPADEGGQRDVEEWRSAVARHWPAERVDCALGIIERESRGDPTAHNRSSNAMGLMQHLLKYWPLRAKGAGFVDGGGLVADPFNGEANIAAGAWLADYYTSRGSSWWIPWSSPSNYGNCSA